MATIDSQRIRIDIPAHPQYLNVVSLCIQGILEPLSELHDREAVVFNIQLGVHEICNNIIEHAYRNEAGHIKIIVTVDKTSQSITFEIFDSGTPFNLSQDMFELPKLGARGYGLFLVNQLLDELKYESQTNQNYWRMIKKLEFSPDTTTLPAAP